MTLMLIIGFSPKFRPCLIRIQSLVQGLVLFWSILLILSCLHCPVGKRLLTITVYCVCGLLETTRTKSGAVLKSYHFVVHLGEMFQ